jgi:outer membrane protein assembly factor BamB
MTPVSDGRHIWMMTSQGVVACYDLDGNQKWLKTFCRDGAEARLHSPVLTEGVLALFFDKEALGLDAATGETKWKAKPSVGFERHQLFAMPLGRTGVVLAQGMIVRVADGKILSANYLAEFQAPHAFPMAVNREDGIVYVNGLFPGKHGLDTAALRLTVAGDQATVELAWKRDGRLGGVDRSNTLGMFSVCYSQGKLYAAGSEFVLDARTGAEVRLAPGTSIPSATRHLLIAGSHVVGVRSKMCWYESCGLEHKEPPRGCDVESRTLDGAPLGAGRLTVPAADTPEKRQQRIDLAAGIYWEFGRAAPFFAGDRIYIRSNDELLCIGKR